MKNPRRRFLFMAQASNNINPLPWVKQFSSFTSECSRCDRCLLACEQNIIIRGDGGFPSVDFTKGECTFCYQCAAACPQSLFKDKKETPWQQKISISKQCLAFHQVDCRCCADSCETQAIRFYLQSGQVAQPRVNEADCTGCGACISPCPNQSISMGEL